DPLTAINSTATMPRPTRGGTAMRRREFITVLGGAATWPLAARAQQPAMPIIGYLDSRSPETVENRLRGFRQGLKDVGYIEGENVTILSGGQTIGWSGYRCWLLNSSAVR